MWPVYVCLLISIQIFSSLRSTDAEYDIGSLQDLDKHALSESEVENELRRNAYNADNVADRIYLKRNMDPIDRSGFPSFAKKHMDPIDRSGFSDFVKKNMDPIDRSGFNSFIKRKLEQFNKMSRYVKKNIDPIDQSGFNDYSKRMPRSASALQQASGCCRYSINNQ